MSLHPNKIGKSFFFSFYDQIHARSFYGKSRSFTQNWLDSIPTFSFFFRQKEIDLISDFVFIAPVLSSEEKERIFFIALQGNVFPLRIALFFSFFLALALEVALQIRNESFWQHHHQLWQKTKKKT